MTTIPEAETVEAAQYLVEQARQQSEPAIIDLMRQGGLGGFPHERLPNPKGRHDYTV